MDASINPCPNMLTNTNCAPISLLQYLKEHVTSIAQDTAIEVSEFSQKLRLFVLSDEYNSESSVSKNTATFFDYTPKRFKNEFLARKHLILVYQGSQIVLGMSAFEYAFINTSTNWSRAYIQYVDTTGLFSPRSNQSHVTKSIVKSYLSYCKDILNMESVHLLAAAKPAFLFAGSEFNEGKRALPAVKLINWWIGLIQDFTSTNNKTTKVFIYSPAEEAEGSSRMRKRISTISNWTYGFPYASGLPCVDHIPLFEDDPKWRHFEATILDNDEISDQFDKKSKKRPKILDDEEGANQSEIVCKMSVKEFFQSIQIRPEFRSDPSAFFVIQFPKRFRDSSSDESKCPLSKSDLATFGLKMLSGLTFESESAAKVSSQKISGWLKLMSVPSFEIKSVILDKENLRNDCKINDSETAKINSLQSLIRKKVSK